MPLYTTFNQAFALENPIMSYMDNVGEALGNVILL